VFASMSAIAEFLPEDISMFLRKHKRVRVSLEEHVSSDVVRGVTDARVDLGVCWDAVDLRGLQTFPYRRDHLAVIATPRTRSRGTSQPRSRIRSISSMWTNRGCGSRRCRLGGPRLSCILP
jgi:DNA-binding transcriptional LysR family regulator